MGIHTSGRVRRDVTALSFAHRVWESIDSPVSLSCHLLLKYGENEQLVRKSIDPLHYIGPAEFFSDYQSVKLLSKYPYLDTKIDVRASAIKEFLRAESRCFETNKRFREREDGAVFRPPLERILSNAQGKISTILGRVPSLEALDFSFGPGAAYGVRKETSAYNKVISDLECTYTLAHKLSEFLEEFPGWIPSGSARVNLVPGSELSFVPKNAKTERPICIEPLLNGLMQKGIGSYMKQRLKRFGIDLSDQTVNQRLAACAIDRSLATVDFTSASDLVSYSLVLNLLPIDWVEFLDAARSPRFKTEGRWYNFHKFSSMGNAYTFELETLIFYALAMSTCEELGISYVTGFDLSVYGDDVIVPQAAFDLFQEVTEVCGFELSREKSFSSGLFFESCGHDYFNGHLVRPYQIKERFDTFSDLFLAANNCRRIATRLQCLPSIRGVGKDQVVHDFYRTRRWIVRMVPKRLQAYGPEGRGDGHVCVEFDEITPHRSKQHPTWECWEYRSHVEEAVKSLPSWQGIPHNFDPLWPTCYALYQTRACHSYTSSSYKPQLLTSRIGRDIFDLREFVKAVDGAAATDNSSGYTVRGRTRTRLCTLITHNWVSGKCWDPSSDGFLPSVKARHN